MQDFKPKIINDRFSSAIALSIILSIFLSFYFILSNNIKDLLIWVVFLALTMPFCIKDMIDKYKNALEIYNEKKRYKVNENLLNEEQTEIIEEKLNKEISEFQKVLKSYKQGDSFIESINKNIELPMDNCLFPLNPVELEKATQKFRKLLFKIRSNQKLNAEEILLINLIIFDNGNFLYRKKVCRTDWI